MSKAIKRAKERYWLEQCNIDTQNKYHAYIEGYHQAEKDLELSWKDISTIIGLYNDLDDKTLCNPNRMCKEILKRFKDFKERKVK